MLLTAPLPLLALLALLALVVARHRRRTDAKRRAQAWLDGRTECEAIYRHLCCYEFPWECFYGINFAFYRTFSSRTIANLYDATGNAASSQCESARQENSSGKFNGYHQATSVARLGSE